MENTAIPLSDPSQSDLPLIQAVKDISFGSAAGMISKVFEHPFDLCKVRLQSQVLDEKVRFNGPIHCLVQTWRYEGVRGLYRGLPPPIVGAMVENASLFVFYGQFQNLIRWQTGLGPNELHLGHLSLAAAGGGFVTSFFLTPIELVKCKMQVQMLTILQPPAGSSTARVPSTPSAHSLPGPFALVRDIVRKHGLKGLWLGQTGTLIRETGGAMAWLGTKEAAASYLVSIRPQNQQDSQEGLKPKEKPQLKMWESAVAGAAAGVMYNVVLFPADSIKSALQTEEELRPAPAASSHPTSSKTASPPAPKPKSFLGMAKEMYRMKGIPGLYAGCGITVARAVPSSAMIFVIYDGLVKYFS